jgi:hypothetical protein
VYYIDKSSIFALNLQLVHLSATDLLSTRVVEEGERRSKNTEAEFLNDIQTKVIRVSLLAIQSHVYISALRFLFLQTYTTSYNFYSALLYTVKQKGGKPYRKPHGLRNPY